MIDNIVDRLLNEGKEDYEVYHETYSSATTEALQYIRRRGFEYDDIEAFDAIGLGPKKPGKGKTVSVDIPIYKNGKKQKKYFHYSVYNRGTDRKTFELTAYIL